MKINPKQFINLQGWMITELGLKRDELIVYALIYGFSQDKESEFHGSIAYVEQWLSCTRKHAIDVLKSLEKKHYIAKRQIVDNKVKYNFYIAYSVDEIREAENDGSIQNILPQYTENATSQYNEDTTHLSDDSNYIDNKDKKESTKKYNKEQKEILETRFQEFYGEYPKQIDEYKTHKEFMTLKPDAELFETIMNALRLQNEVCFKHREEQYIPSPYNWLKNKKWNDKVYVPKQYDDYVDPQTKADADSLPF